MCSIPRRRGRSRPRCCIKLVEATWYNTIADFPSLSVGVTYLPIPLGGAALFLFVIERLACGAPEPLPPTEQPQFD